MRSAFTITVTVLLACVGASVAMGQTPRPEIEREDLGERVDQLDERLKNIEDSIAELTERLRADASQVDVAPETATPDDEFTRFQAEVRTRLNALEDRLLAATESPGASAAMDTTQLLSAMKADPNVRLNLFKATNGRFEVHNQMVDWMAVRLNGQSWRFPPGVSSIYIPFGVVQVQLVDGGDRHTFAERDWQIVGDELVLKMGITTELPQQE